MGSIIRASGNLFNSLLSLNSWLGSGLYKLKDLYSVISVIQERLPAGNTKKCAIAPFVDDQIAISRTLGG